MEKQRRTQPYLVKEEGNSEYPTNISPSQHFIFKLITKKKNVEDVRRTHKKYHGMDSQYYLREYKNVSRKTPSRNVSEMKILVGKMQKLN